MSKGGGGGTQTVINKTELPEWVSTAAQNNLNAAYNVSENMLGPYRGPRVAGMTNGAIADIALAQNNIGSTNPAFASAQSTAADISNYQPGQVNPATLAGTNLSAYMNPYTQNVIASGLQAIDTQRQQALNQVGDQAIRANAFGGSRQGVQEGVTNAAAALQAGNLASNLMAQNFSQAQAAAQGDIARNLQAQQLNQQAGLQGAGLNLQAANQLGGLAAQGQTSFLQGLSAALAGQGTVQQQRQAEIAAQQQAYQEAQQFPIQQLQVPLQALGVTPYGQTNTQTGPGPTSNPWLTGLGAAASGVGILGGLSNLGAFSALAALSDRNEKTDIKKLGKDPSTGLNMYAYRYKGDPKSYPKIVGPMAQEVEEKYPDMVSEINGKKIINLGFGGV